MSLKFFFVYAAQITSDLAYHFRQILFLNYGDFNTLVIKLVSFT